MISLMQLLDRSKIIDREVLEIPGTLSGAAEESKIMLNQSVDRIGSDDTRIYYQESLPVRVRVVSQVEVGTRFTLTFSRDS